jgi:DNA-binding response OmpR family regulator
VKVLLVEDDPVVAEPLLEGLKRHGFETVHVAYASLVLEAVLAGVDVVLLDLGLPDGDGLDVLREIRHRADVPVIVVTARGDEADRVVGLELGADDYVVKPFSVRELAARVRAVARRRRIEPNLESGRLVVDRTRHLVTVDGEPVELTAKEFDLLITMVAEPGIVFTRERLLERAWGFNEYVDARGVDVHILHVREKLGDEARAPRFIETVRGVGYRVRRDAR